MAGKWERFKQSWLFQPVVFFVGMIIFAGLMDQVVMPLYVKLGDEIELPDVIEMNVQEAQQLLQQRGFNVIIQDSLYDANQPVGTVIDQNPYPYATVKEGRRVYLTVSIGEKPIIMPKLFGLSPRDAELILKSYNLKLNSKIYAYSDIYPEGIVIGQSYPQGQEVKSGQAIDITISLGKMQEKITVPALVGKSLQAAKEKLKILKIPIGEITFEERDNILPETVLGQSLPAGHEPADGEVIDLVVSKEPVPESEGY